jgi:hypothetical protein
VRRHLTVVEAQGGGWAAVRGYPHHQWGAHQLMRGSSTYLLWRRGAGGGDHRQCTISIRDPTPGVPASAHLVCATSTAHYIKIGPMRDLRSQFRQPQ